MALSIVPLLFSLLLSLAPASTTGNDLVVRVVDKEGKPVAGVQVGLCPHWAGHSSTSGIGVSDAAGNARIERGLDVVRSDAQRQYFVRLGAPLDPDVRSEVDREHLDDFHPVLAVPEHGRVILKLPEVVAENCTARLRCVPRSEERSAIWSGSSLPQIKCKEHQAVCEFVGLGLDLEYEVLGDSLPRPLQGSFHGPEKPGELVTFAVPGFEASPRFIARLVAEDSKPIAHVRLQWDLGTHVESSNSGSGGWQGGNATTDGAGRVVIPITEEQASWPNRTLILKDVNDPVGAEPIRGPAVKVSIPNDARTHEIDLGELMLASFGSPKKFAALDDAALEKHYLELVEAGMRASDEDGDGHVEILSEMIRRGGAELEHFVAGLADGAPHESWRTSGSQPSELVLRTALARMRRKPDPLTVVVDEGSLLDVDFPVIPTLKCQLVNLDSEGRAYPLDTVRNSYCRIVALDSAGHEARQRVTEQTGGWGSIGDLKGGTACLCTWISGPSRSPRRATTGCAFTSHPAKTSIGSQACKAGSYSPRRSSRSASGAARSSSSWRGWTSCVARCERATSRRACPWSASTGTTGPSITARPSIPRRSSSVPDATPSPPCSRLSRIPSSNLFDAPGSSGCCGTSRARTTRPNPVASGCSRRRIESGSGQASRKVHLGLFPISRSSSQTRASKPS